jgi:hypothetical protein
MLTDAEGSATLRTAARVGSQINSDTNKLAVLSPGIRDRLFINQLKYTQDLINFLVQKQVTLDKSLNILSTLADLGNVYYWPMGRNASAGEWQSLYSASHEFMSQLPKEMYSSFALWRLRNFFTVLPLVCLTTAMTIGLEESCWNCRCCFCGRPVLSATAAQQAESQRQQTQRWIMKSIAELDQLNPDRVYAQSRI